MAGDAARLWIDGGFTVRVFGPEDGRGRDVAFDRPYALVGRFVEAGVRIDDPGVSNRHAYLHLDRRGLFAVDLASRTGTRVGADGQGAAWLAPGDAIEVAGHRIELISTRVEPGGDEPTGDDPLSDAGPESLARVTLYPNRPAGAPLVLGSELIFIGRSPNCGVRVEGASASRIHCVLVRTKADAFLVELVGRGLWVNDESIQGATRLRDGDSLMIGSARFDVRIEPPGAWKAPAAQTSPSTELVAREPSTELALPPGIPPLPAGLLPAESQAALIGWMMGVIQANQEEMMRRQDDLRRDMVGILGQMHRDHKATLRHHLERVEAVHHDLSSLREEIGRRFSADVPIQAASPPHAPSGSIPVPRPEPIPIPRPEPPPFPASEANPAAAASWLLSRVNQLETENRSTWRDLLSRISGGSGSPPQGS